MIKNFYLHIKHNNIKKILEEFDHNDIYDLFEENGISAYETFIGDISLFTFKEENINFFLDIAEYVTSNSYIVYTVDNLSDIRVDFVNGRFGIRYPFIEEI